MPYRRFNRWLLIGILIPLGAVTIIGLFLLLSPNQGVERSNRLARLRYSNAACSTFLFDRPKVLVVGDSHTYAGIEYNVMAKLLGTENISSCAIGGFYVDSILKVFEAMERYHYAPEVIIYGASLRQFLDDYRRQKQLVEHEKIYKNLGIHPLKMLQVIKAQWEPSFDLKTTNQAKVALHQPFIQNLDDKKIAANLKNLHPSASSEWLKVIHGSKFMEEAPQITAQICDFVRAHQIKFYVVSVPESPYLEGLYPKEMLQRYEALLAGFKPCAPNVVVEPASGYGLGNRHFLNLAMDEQFPYAAWNSPDHHPTEEEFNLDHLNLVGAVGFTTSALEKLAPID